MLVQQNDFVWFKGCKQIFSIRMCFYTVCSTGMALQLKGTKYREHDSKLFIITRNPLNLQLKLPSFRLHAKPSVRVIKGEMA